MSNNKKFKNNIFPLTVDEDGNIVVESIEKGDILRTFIKKGKVYVELDYTFDDEEELVEDLWDKLSSPNFY